MEPEKCGHLERPIVAGKLSGGGRHIHADLRCILPVGHEGHHQYDLSKLHDRSADQPRSE